MKRFRDRDGIERLWYDPTEIETVISLHEYKLRSQAL